MTQRKSSACARIGALICLGLCLTGTALPVRADPVRDRDSGARLLEIRQEKEAMMREREARRARDPAASRSAAAREAVPRRTPSPATAEPSKSQVRLPTPAAASVLTPWATDLVPAPNLPVAASLPLARPLPVTGGPQDRVTLADLKDHLQATPDDVLLQRDRLFVLDLVAALLSPGQQGGTSGRR